MANSDSDEILHFSQMGMAALLPGMQHMLDQMQRELDRMRIQLAAAQGREVVTTMPGKRRGRPPKDAVPQVTLARASGWPADPEERRREMKRRQAVARENRLAQEAVRAERGVKIGKAAKKQWEAMTVRQRKQRLAAMQAGRGRKRVNGALEATA